MRRGLLLTQAGRILMIGVFLVVGGSLLASLGAIDLPSLAGSSAMTSPTPPTVIQAQPSPALTQGYPVATLSVLAIALLVAGYLFLRRKRVNPGGRLVWQTIGILIGVAAYFILSDTVWSLPYPRGDSLQGTTLVTTLGLFVALATVGGVLIYLAIVERKRALLASSMSWTADPVARARALTASLRRRLYSDRGSEADRDSVLACYSAMTQVLASHGSADRPSFTPREFQRSSGSTLKVSGSSITDLTSIFEKARYAASPVTHADALTAVEALDSLVGELEGGSR